MRNPGTFKNLGRLARKVQRCQQLKWQKIGNAWYFNVVWIGSGKVAQG